VDLSYNVMPVLTYDITVGTGRVEVLNISYNILNEIRQGEFCEYLERFWCPKYSPMSKPNQL